VRTLAWVLVACIVAETAGGCGRSRETSSEPGPSSAAGALRDVSLPDLSTVDPGVQAQAREMYDALQKMRGGANAPPEELALAYGQYAILLPPSFVLSRPTCEQRQECRQCQSKSFV